MILVPYPARVDKGCKNSSNYYWNVNAVIRCAPLCETCRKTTDIHRKDQNHIIKLAVQVRKLASRYFYDSSINLAYLEDGSSVHRGRFYKIYCLREIISSLTSTEFTLMVLILLVR